MGLSHDQVMTEMKVLHMAQMDYTRATYAALRRHAERPLTEVDSRPLADI